MSTIKAILFFFSLFLFPVIGNNCSCGPYIETFCEAMPSLDGVHEFYVVAAKVTKEAHGEFGQYMQVEIRETLHNTLESDTIVVIGQDGVNCGASLGGFSLNSGLIMYLFPDFFTGASSDTLYLDGCGRSWLQLESGVVNGPIRPEVNSENYQTFKDSLSACSNFITSTRDIEQLTQSVQVFPNPVHDLLNIQSADYAIQTMTLFSITGQKIAEKQAGFHKNTSFDLQGLAAGLYFVNIQINGQIVSKKIVKQ